MAHAVPTFGDEFLDDDEARAGEYRRRAEELQTLAANVSDDDVREDLTGIAQAYIGLALRLEMMLTRPAPPSH